VPFLEQLSVLDDLVKAGKIRHVGLSNETAWGTTQFLRLAETMGLPRMAAIQNAYNLLCRNFEFGLAEIAMQEQCGLLAYSPLAGGALSGKYLGGARPEGARLTLFGEYFGRYTKPRGIEATASYVALAEKHGLVPLSLALAFVLSRPFVTSAIIGATTTVQLLQDLELADTQLSAEVLAGIGEIHADINNPAA
jgi:aryl-alcohol dehydrogenase-like predicted oxidoreductase